MNFDEFDKMLKAKAAEIKRQQGALLTKLSADGLRFVDDNFRNQSWEGKPWLGIARDGTILVHHGDLKRSFNDELKPNEVRIYSNVKYAAVHNEGFDGTQSVKAYKRGKYQRTGRGKKKKTGTGDVKAFTRHMKIKQRQFAPTDTSPSPTLEKKVNETITTHYSTILNS
jgi:phage gpG-like protein